MHIITWEEHSRVARDAHLCESSIRDIVCDFSWHVLKIILKYTEKAKF